MQLVAEYSHLDPRSPHALPPMGSGDSTSTPDPRVCSAPSRATSIDNVSRDALAPLVRQGIAAEPGPGRPGPLLEILFAGAGVAGAKEIAVGWAVWTGGEAPAFHKQADCREASLAWLAACQCWGCCGRLGCWTLPWFGAAACGPALTRGAVPLCAFMPLGHALLPGVPGLDAGRCASNWPVWGSLIVFRGCPR